MKGGTTSSNRGKPFNAKELIPGILTKPEKFKGLECIYLSCGNMDGRTEGMQTFRDELKEAGYGNVVWEEFPGNHEWKVWRRSLVSFVQLLFKN